MRDEQGQVTKWYGSSSDIDDLKRAHQEIREHTERYELVVAGANDAIWDWDVLSRRVHYSSQWKQLRGYAPHELSDREEEWTRGIHPEDAPRVMSRLQDHFEGRSPVFAEEYRICCRDGSWKRVADRGMARRDETGRVVLMAGSERDVTARRRAESLLEARLRLLTLKTEQVSGIPALLQATLDEAERITESQIGFFHFIAPDQEGVVLQAWSSRTLESACRIQDMGGHHASASEAGIWLDCLREGRAIIHNDYAGLAGRRGLPEGHVPLVRQLTLPLQRSGKAVAVVGLGNKESDYTQDDVQVLQDLASLTMERVTAIQAEEALRLSQERLRVALEAAYMISFEWDIQRNEVHRILSSSLALPPTPEKTPSRFEAVREVVHPLDRERFVANVQAALEREDGLYENEFRVLRPDGRVDWLHERGRVERDAAGRPARLVGVSQDFTQHKLNEESLRLQTETLQARNLELDRFNRATVGRELEMVRLKRQINDLSRLLGAAPPYSLDFLDDCDRPPARRPSARLHLEPSHGR